MISSTEYVCHCLARENLLLD
uniref:Uncharacterized protein n=1 Tax=Anguilla anguilla TaxID=7936 RepID=A0A0E9S2J0_ANGAN